MLSCEQVVQILQPDNEFSKQLIVFVFCEFELNFFEKLEHKILLMLTVEFNLAHDPIKIIEDFIDLMFPVNFCAYEQYHPFQTVLVLNLFGTYPQLGLEKRVEVSQIELERIFQEYCIDVPLLKGLLLY